MEDADQNPECNYKACIFGSELTPCSLATQLYAIPIATLETYSLQVIEEHKANHAKLSNELRAREAVAGCDRLAFLKNPEALKVYVQSRKPWCILIGCVS